MQTECIPDIFGFEAVEGREVIAAFDGGAITSDAGALLLGATDRAIRMVDRLASCFVDRRSQAQVEHSVATLVGQRIFAIALGYEDLNDHETLRHDPLMAVLAGKLEARRADCAAVAGKSTLNRLELSKPEPSRYHKIGYDAEAVDRLFVDLFLEAHRTAPSQITLDLDATDDPLHGQQEGLSLSETSSGWRLTENRAMLLFNEGSFQAHWLDGCRSISVAGSARGRDLDITAAN